MLNYGTDIKSTNPVGGNFIRLLALLLQPQTEDGENMKMGKTYKLKETYWPKDLTINHGV